jgi:hypothetical protein
MSENSDSSLAYVRIELVNGPEGKGYTTKTSFKQQNLAQTLLLIASMAQAQQAMLEKVLGKPQTEEKELPAEPQQKTA